MTEDIIQRPLDILAIGTLAGRVPRRQERQGPHAHQPQVVGSPVAFASLVACQPLQAARDGLLALRGRLPRAFGTRIPHWLTTTPQMGETRADPMVPGRGVVIVLRPPGCFRRVNSRARSYRGRDSTGSIMTQALSQCKQAMANVRPFCLAIPVCHCLPGNCRETRHCLRRLKRQSSPASSVGCGPPQAVAHVT